MVAAVLLQIYLTLFPLYVAHFLTGYAASISSIVILLIFFYYFAVILFIGAEVNAFFAEGITSTPTDLVTMVHISTSHLPKTPSEKEKQAAPTHKVAPTGDTAAKTHLDDSVNNPNLKASAILTTASAPTAHDHSQVSQPLPEHKEVTVTKNNHNKSKGSSSTISATIAAVAGTALAFIVEMVRLRRGKAS